MTAKMRSGLLLRTCMEILRERGRMTSRAAVDEIGRRVDLTPYELAPVKSGRPRWDVDVRFHSGNAASVGWLVKQDNTWWITDAGAAALDRYPSPDGLISEVTSRYREIYASRKEARRKLGGKVAAIAAALELVPKGSWTSHEDLAELVGASPEEVAHLLADGEALPNAYRVLTADGTVPPAGQLNFAYRGADLRARLAAEGVEFNGDRASAEQQLPAEVLQELAVEEPASPRAWLVRGSNVDGVDLVPQWLADGFVSLAAAQLPPTDILAGDTELRQVVDQAYRHKNYSVRERLVAEFGMFLRQMRAGDTVLTTQGGRFYVGIIDGPVEFVDSTDRRSNLRRPVRWLNQSRPFDLPELASPLPILVQSQDDVIDLTNALDAVDQLLAQLDAGKVIAPEAPPAQADLADVTDELADALLTDRVWLDDIVELLRYRQQIVFYGPPGTGKTYLATRLAEHLTERHAVTLVQFHPSYTYEDFFEGFRPEPTDDGSLRFRLRPGPFRRLADDAREHPGTAYILVIDEINRGNLAKIFGEMYFLLEYRDQRISLQYSQEGDFTLPRNLYLIGTMNTADRSIALVDAAMRRRFAFVEMHPDKPPVKDLLRRWLAKRGLPPTAADLLDRLNQRLADADYAIGPSYLMRDEVYAKPDEGFNRVWRHDILPLLVEHHYADRIDVLDRYGLDSLRAALP